MIFPIKAVIFDADGVLLDSLSVWKELGKRYITDLGYQPVAEMDEILFPMSMEQGADWLKNRFTLAYSEEKIVMDLKSRIRKYYFEEVPAKSGARELLQCLAEQKIPVELHIFEKGGHGLSLGSRLTCNQSGYGLNPACQRWLELVHTWIENCLAEE